MERTATEDVNELSRQTSRQTTRSEDAISVCSFPNLSEHSTAVEHATHKQPLNGLLGGDGPSMFDDNHDNSINATNPQSLSAAPRSVLQSVIDYHGAVELVQRLSTALAERDAHITALIRLAEEYKIPQERVTDTASRIKRAERRRLSLAAASEDVLQLKPIGSDRGSLHVAERAAEDIVPATGFTKLFGGGGKRRESLKPTPNSSRSTSRQPQPVRRPQSIDVPNTSSNHRHRGSDASGWASTLFSTATNYPSRHDSLDNRIPVEMLTRHDKDQLPPTLSIETTADPQEAEWNAFLVRLVELRQQNGEDVSGGEMIGASHFGREGNEGRKKLEQLSRLIIGGIPMKLRHAIWMELSNASTIIKPNEYSNYLGLRDGDDQAEIEAILKDVPRTLTSKYDFYTGKGFKKLKDVLFAFVSRYPNLGYTQGLNTIAGYLLLAIPSEEDAFWLLCNIVENFFPKDYFARMDALISPLADNLLLHGFVKATMPQLYEQMDKLKILPEHTAPMKWFFTAFSNGLPEATVMRLWDVWLCLPNQKNFLFAFALALLESNTEGILACEDDAAYFAYLDSGLKLPEDSEQITELIKTAYRISRKLVNVGKKRSEVKESMRLEHRLRRKKTPSLEVLLDRD